MQQRKPSGSSSTPHGGKRPRRPPPRGANRRTGATARSTRGARASPPAGPPRRSPTRKADPIEDEIRRTARPGTADAAIKAFQTAVGLLERGRDAAAVRAAEEAKTLAPRSGAVRETLGIALYRAGRYRDALRELQAYRRMTGRADQNHLIADSYRATGVPDKAVTVAREALRQRLPDATRAETAIVAASALADLGRYGEALGLLRDFPGRVGVGQDWELRVWYVTADILERADRHPEALAEFHKILRHDPDAFDVAERLAAMGG